MKKFFVFFCLFLFPAVCLANQQTYSQLSKEANFRLETLAPWQQMSISRTTLDKSPAWLIRFSAEKDSENFAPFGLFVVDGRKNPDIKQTAEDFKKGHANFLLFQIVEAEKFQTREDGLVLKESQVKQYGKHTYIYLRYENQAHSVYKIMTAFENYLYSFNCQVENKNSPEKATILTNLELMLNTLSKY